MRRRAIPSVLLAGLFAALLGTTEAGEPPAGAGALPQLVANPKAEAWARFRPGAWVKVATDTAPDFQDESFRLESIQVLVEVNVHDVVIWTGPSDPVNPGATAVTFPGALDVADRRVGSDEAPATWTGTLPGLGTSKDSSERVRVAGKDLDCRVVDVTIAGGDTPLRRARVWHHVDVPGGIVRSEVWTERAHTRSEVVAFGMKPDGSFTYPPKIEPGYELVEAPMYAEWSRLPIGAWVQTRHEATRGMRTSYSARMRLVEIRRNCLFLEIATLDQDVRETPEGQAAPPEAVPTSQGKKSPGLVPVRRRVPARLIDSRLKVLDWTVTEAPKVSEILVVAGRKLVCTVTEETAVHATDPMRLRRKVWSHPDVPGTTVKSEVETTSHGQRSSFETSVVEAWHVPGK
jgi:hypothetical protein